MQVLSADISNGRFGRAVERTLASLENGERMPVVDCIPDVIWNNSDGSSECMQLTAWVPLATADATLRQAYDRIARAVSQRDIPQLRSLLNALPRDQRNQVKIVFETPEGTVVGNLVHFAEALHQTRWTSIHSKPIGYELMREEFLFTWNRQFISFLTNECRISAASSDAVVLRHGERVTFAGSEFGSRFASWDRAEVNKEAEVKKEKEAS